MEQQQIDLTRPIVIKVKKKKNRKYSPGLRDIQVTGRSLTGVSSRMARAVTRGWDTYRKASDKSSRKKRDGALRDLNRNLAKGLSRSLRESSRIPFDIAKAVDTRGSRRYARRQIRAASRFSRLLRFR